MALHQDAAQRAADAAATQAVIVVLAQANPAKALPALTMVVALLPSVQRKLAVVVHSAAVVVVLVVAIKAILAPAVVMTSSPATFATTQVATSQALAQTTKKITTNEAATPAVSPTHCAPA